jgi:hypothetical protein
MHYPSIRIEGGILSPEILSHLDDAHGQRPADFGLDGSVKVKDEIARAWADAQDYWRIFHRKLDSLKTDIPATTETRNHWIVPLLGLLGYQLEYQHRGTEIGEKSYPISHRVMNRGQIAAHIVGYRDPVGLDRKPERTALRMSAHAMVQEYLNLSDPDHLYAVVTNGRVLRLLRDSSRLVKLTYLEFDLDRIFTDGLFADFAVLYRLLHVTRLPVAPEAAPESLIEHYHQDSVVSGERIRDGLSEAVKQVILAFANGLLAHPSNDALRAAIQSGELKSNAFYQNLLRLIYRLLFLLVIEERFLVYPLAPSAEKRELYYRYYSLQRLRKLSEKRHLADHRKEDLWLALLACFRLFEAGGPGPKLGIAPLAGDLFHPEAIGPINRCLLDNATVLGCLRSLSLYQNPDTNQLIRVNYAALNVEEFGSVYEGLLEYEPVFIRHDQRTEFAFAQGDERAATGSHYTPDDLVQPLLKNSLDHLIVEKLKEANKEKALLSLRVADISCGSGHILLAAARRIATELAIVRTGEEQPSPSAFRAAVRDVIRECIYGVDLNPLAVELCKVALWLEAHNPGEPLNFLDHHIKCGNAIVGFAKREELERGVPDEAFATMPGDDKEVASTLRKRNKAERAEKKQRKLELAPELEQQLQTILKRWQEISGMSERNPAEIETKKKRYVEFTQSQDAWLLSQVACIPVAQFFLPKTLDNRPKLITDEEFRAYLSGQRHPQGQATAAAWATSVERRFFHWFLEFPEILERGGFDCILGNPPYLGGQDLSGTYGHSFCYYVKYEYAPTGLSDLVAYFVRRIYSLLRPGGLTAFITTNSIKDGDLRKDGLEQVLAASGSINFAIRGIKWPGRANLVVSLVSIYKGPWSGKRYLDGKEVAFISSYFEDHADLSEAAVLLVNKGWMFNGSNILGDGFYLTKDEAEGLLNASDGNSQVVFPVMNGQELNNLPAQNVERYIINFFDWPLDQAQNFLEPYTIIENRVFPERVKIPRDTSINRHYHDHWWQYGVLVGRLYEKLKRLEHCFVLTATTKYLGISRLPASRVYTHAVRVLASDRWDLFAVLQSTLHDLWARKYSGAHETRLRYSPTDCFEAFPFPEHQWHTPDTALAAIGERYHEYRRSLMLRLWLGLTDIYNLFHDRDLTPAAVVKASGKPADAEHGYQGILQLRVLHRELDEAILAAYGWNGQITLNHDFHEVETLPENDRVRYTVSPAARKEILRHFLALNHERHAQQVAAEVKPTKKTARKKAQFTETMDELSLGLADFSLFAQAYPSTASDKLICALALEFVEWRQSISSNDHLDALILATHPNICRALTVMSDKSQIDTLTIPFKGELDAIGTQGLKWAECLNYLAEHRQAIVVKHLEAGHPIGKGAKFDLVRQAFPSNQGGLAGLALTAMDSLKKGKQANTLTAEQRAASDTFDQLHSKYVLT